MANSRELGILVTMQDNFSRELTRLQKGVGSFESGIKKVGGAIAAAFAVNSIADFAKQSVTAAQESIYAQERLATLLNNSVGATDAQVDALLRQADALQKVGVISKDNIVTAQGTLATFDLQISTIERLIPSMLNYVVAEKGVNATTQDMISVANGFGKALQGQTKLLTDAGFKLTDIQKKMLETGSETQRLETLTGVLGQTYDGLNEKIGQTFVGRMKQAQFAVADLKEGIGMALIPTIESLTQGLFDQAQSTENSNEWVNELAKTFYRITHLTIAAIKVLYLMVQAQIALTDTMISAVRISANFAKDFIAAFFAIKDNILPILKGIAMALTGDISGGLDELKSAVSSSFSGTISEMERLSFNTQGFASLMGDTYSSIGESMVKGMDYEGFQPVTRSAINAAKSIKSSTENMGSSVEKATVDVEKLTEKYQDFQMDAGDAVRTLQDEHKKSLASVREDIKKTEQSIKDLRQSFEQEKASDMQRVAEEVVRTEENVANLQKQIAGEANSEKRAEMEAELAKQQQALLDNKSFIESIETAVVEARRRSGLTDLERTIEDYEIKRQLAQTEFDTKMKNLQTELESFKKKEKEEQKLYADKIALMMGIQKLASDQYAKTMEAEFALTKEKVEGEIKLYQELAKAIASVRGGKATDLSSIQSRVSQIAPGFNVSVNVNGDVSGKELIDKVQKGIMDSLRMNQRLSVT